MEYPGDQQWAMDQPDRSVQPSAVGPIISIKVPDVPSPMAKLCWEPDSKSMARCDRKKGHIGPHTWQMMAALLEMGVIIMRVINTNAPD